jgi:hypothetical protein
MVRYEERLMVATRFFSMAKALSYLLIEKFNVYYEPSSVTQAITLAI